MDYKYKLDIDFSNDTILLISKAGHGKPLRLTYEDIQKNPTMIDSLSGKDAYLLGTFFASKYCGKFRFTQHPFRYKFLVVLSVIFTTLMLVSNLLSTKLISIHGVTLTGAILVYPLSYIFNYIITDTYGYQNARRVALSVIVALIIFNISIYVTMRLPASPYWHLQQQFSAVFGQMARTCFAATVSFSVEIFIASYLIQKIKIYYNGGRLFRRLFSALLISESINTGLFCIIAFVGVWPLVAMVKFLMLSYLIKIMYELSVYRLVTKPVITYIKAKERMDIMDCHTHFTPFSWSVSYTKDDNLYNAKTGESCS